MNATLELPPAAASVREGRRFVTSLLQSWGLDGLVETTALLTSELLTNSVLHARTTIRLSVAGGEDCVEVLVRDGSRQGPRRRRHARDATTGRGVELLERLATTWDVGVDDQGKSVRFTVTADSDPWAAYAGVDWADAEL